MGPENTHFFGKIKMAGIGAPHPYVYWLPWSLQILVVCIVEFKEPNKLKIEMQNHLKDSEAKLSLHHKSFLQIWLQESINRQY